MSTVSSSEEESVIGRFFKKLNDTLQFLFAEIQNDYQTIPEGYGKQFLKNGQLALIFFYIVVTIMLIIYAVFYRIDKKKLSKIELPYNIETISYQAIDFTHPKYKGKYQYFPLIVIISIVLFLLITVFISIMINFNSFQVKGFYFIMAVLLIIPIIVYIILYTNISKYLKPRNVAKKNINKIFYKYMIDDLNAKSQLSVIPPGGRYSTLPMVNALRILASQTQNESSEVKQQKLTKAILTFTLYKYYVQKSMEDYLLERALADTFSKYVIKEVDYCKYLPNNIRSLITYDISKIIRSDIKLSSTFSSKDILKARQAAIIILREVNGYFEKLTVDENIVKKFIMTNTVIWIVLIAIISIILSAAMKFRVQPKAL